jgi:hypothetical protein
MSELNQIILRQIVFTLTYIAIGYYMFTSYPEYTSQSITLLVVLFLMVSSYNYKQVKSILS